uniref:Facilitated trehalose transporter Tret1-2 n=1 Tax=Lygus hesperus TaxID=30085 RepID=A0A146M049_LYGHE
MVSVCTTNNPTGVSSVVTVSLTALNSGIATGWIKPRSLPLAAGANLAGRFYSLDVTYDIKEMACPAVLSAILLGLVANFCGRKPALYLTLAINILGVAIPGNFYDAFSNWLVTASWSCAIFSGLVIGPVLLSEIAHKSVRGTLITFCFLQFNLGLVISNSYFHFILNSIDAIYLFVLALQLLLLTFIPESPFFLVSKSKITEAEESLFWCRGSNRLVAKDEVETLLKSSLSFQNQDLIGIIKSRPASKALIISFGLVFFQRMTGLLVFLFYSDEIVRNAGNFLGYRDAALVFGGIQLAISIVGMWCVDSIGRKSLLFISFGGSCLSLSVLSSFLALRIVYPILGKLSWIPLACMFVFTASHSAGAPLSSIIPNEVSPVKIKGLMASINGICTSIFVLLEIGIVLLVKQLMGNYSFLHFLIPAVLSGIALIFTRSTIPETKGKSLMKCSDEMISENDDHRKLLEHSINYF